MKPKLKKLFSSFTKTKGLTLFVTVGSTKFDALIERILNDEVNSKLSALNVTKLILQIGNCSNENILKRLNIGKPHDDSSIISSPKKKKLEIEAYNFKSSISEDIDRANFVISHAGAGTCLDVLRKGKPLLVVTNDDLMNNHQTELADELFEQNYVLKCSVNDLKETVTQIFYNHAKLKQFPPANPVVFNNIFENCLSHTLRTPNSVQLNE